ncbi:MAG: hypothetical protein J2P56_09065, partial [Verrucomicrobia bacterium]|nr:hypothetical protein [Verrucomicrobiota bacterium]
MATLHLVQIPSRIVEPLSAASIVFVGVENLLSRDIRGASLYEFECNCFVFAQILSIAFVGVPALLSRRSGIFGSRLEKLHCRRACDLLPHEYVSEKPKRADE